MFCVGCHSGISAATDSNFSFPGKLAAGHADYFADNTGKSRDATASPLVYMRQLFEEGDKTDIETPVGAL